MTIDELIELLDSIPKTLENRDVYVELPDRSQDFFVDTVLVNPRGVFIQTAE